MVTAFGGSSITDTAQINPGVVEGSDILDATIAAADIGDNAVGDAEIAAHTTTKITVPLSRIATGTKGDLIVGNATGVPTFLGVGSNNQVLIADSAQASGVRWGSAPTETQVFIPAPAFFPFNNASISAASGFAIATFANNLDGDIMGQCRVPTGVTSISSIIIAYQRKSAGNLWLAFTVGHCTQTTPNTAETDTLAAAAYSGVANDDAIGYITVPSTAYDGLAALAAGHIISIQITRTGSNASDTYEQAWTVQGVFITFA